MLFLDFLKLKATYKTCAFCTKRAEGLLGSSGYIQAQSMGRKLILPDVKALVKQKTSVYWSCILFLFPYFLVNHNAEKETVGLGLDGQQPCC